MVSFTMTEKLRLDQSWKTAKIFKFITDYLKLFITQEIQLHILIDECTYFVKFHNKDIIKLKIVRMYNKITT